MSWIIRDKATGQVVGEFFNPKLRAALNTDKYEAIDAAVYLGELNAAKVRGYLDHAGHAHQPPLVEVLGFDPLDPMPLGVPHYAGRGGCKCKTCNDTAPDEL